jgi:hypothetical protein
MRNDPAARDDGVAMRPTTDRGRARGAVVGGLVVLAALGIGQLAAAFGTPAASPPVAIGQATIDASPQPLKSWAIRTFGADDKTVLVAGILAVLVVVALALGPVAVRRPGIGALAVAAAAALAAVCAVTRPEASAGWALPSILAGLAGLVALRVLVPTPSADRPGPGSERTVAYDRRRFLRAAVAVGAVGVGSAVVGVRRSRDRGAI